MTHEIPKCESHPLLLGDDSDDDPLVSFPNEIDETFQKDDDEHEELLVWVNEPNVSQLPDPHPAGRSSG